ncbi:amino acid ABC transporter permease [Kineosporia mesophila]|uniref:Amino acid ABC transporter permease n=1 Tax=Kineosporia mesophila TaxID=566012 RepID=A0ABP6Z2A2_9ACTN|nr:amino acid ABC transporter permease [Kineosporia mesophila]MCD5353942.1 amino acid ABC transporter permease [Kineosporia mesophila]
MSDTNLSVLYDVPGPRARRRALVGSVVVGLLTLAVLYLIYARLDDQGQFESDRWSPLLDPSDESFQAVWKQLGTGLRNTLVGALVAITLSVAIGIVLGIARVMLGRRSRVPLVAVIEFFRGLPVVVLMYMAYQLLPDLGVNYEPLPGPDAFWWMVVGLVAYNSVIFAEILRAGVNSLPGGQREAGLVIGLTPLQTMRMIQLPQAFRTMLPAIISQMVVVLKDTSLIAFIGGYEELLRKGQFVYLNLKNPLQTLLFVAIIFIAVNFTLSWLANLAQRRMSRRSAGRGINPIHLDPGSAGNTTL